MELTYKQDETFCRLAKLVLQSEGKFANHPSDKGGPTMYGVAWNFNADWLKANCGMSKPMDIKNLTLDQARQCFYERYWLGSGGNGIDDIDLAYMHFDTAINCGTGTARLMCARLSRNPRHYDFSNGKNRTLAMTLFLEYTAQRLDFYADCKDRDEFLSGWIHRMSDVIQNSLGME